MALGPLSEQEAAKLLAGEPDARRRRQIFVEGGGNPFYMEQLLRAGVGCGSGSPRRGAGPRGEGSVQIPRAVAAVLAGELRHLSAPARRMLEGAAVAGEPFEPELAAEAAGIDPELALELLDELVARDFVRPDPVPRLFRFRHPIVQAGRL